MTKAFNDLFNLPSMEEVLAETADVEDDCVEQIEELSPVIPTAELITVAEMKAQEHGQSMDKLYDELLGHAREMTELALNLDPARSPRMFEVAEKFYKSAMDAKNSKRDAQLKMMKVLQDQRKLELDELKLKHEMGDTPVDKADVIMVEDRNQLLKRLRDDMKNR